MQALGARGGGGGGMAGASDNAHDESDSLVAIFKRMQGLRRLANIGMWTLVRVRLCESRYCTRITATHFAPGDEDEGIQAWEPGLGRLGTLARRRLALPSASSTTIQARDKDLDLLSVDQW